MSDSFKPGPFECLVDRRHRTDAHFRRVDAGHCHRTDAGHGLESQLLRLLFGHHQHGRRAHAHLRAIPRRHRTAGRVERRRKLRQTLQRAIEADPLVLANLHFAARLVASPGGDDLGVECAAGRGLGGQAVAAEREFVLLLAGDLVLLRHVLGRQPHVHDGFAVLEEQRRAAGCSPCSWARVPCARRRRRSARPRSRRRRSWPRR